MTDVHVLIDELKTGSSVRKQEVQHLLAVMGGGIIELLIETVLESNPEHIRFLLDGIDWQLEEAQRSEPPFILLQYTIDSEGWYVAAISDLLVKLGVKSVPDILPLLSHKESLVRAWAAHLLGDIGDSTSSPFLVAHLKAEGREERLRAIKTLGTLKAREAVDQLISLLGEDEGETNAAASALGKIHDLRAIPPLIELLRKNRSVYAASAALHQFGEYAVEPQIQILSDATASPVHDLVLMNLWMLNDKRAITPILKVLETANAEKIRSSAIIALGNLKAQQAIEPISRILYENTTEQWACTMALAKIDGKRGFHALTTALEKGSQEVQRAAALAFGEMDHVEEIDPILTALKHPDSRVRSAIAVALGNLGDERAIAALKDALADPDDATRHYASGSLQKIESRSTR